jgi:hypothetical protein
MAIQRDVSTVQMLFAIARGSGGMRIAAEGAAWLHGRYVPWLTEAKPEIGRSPLEMWDERGHGFLAKFRDIGARAAMSAAGAPEMTMEDLAAAASVIEGESDCPWCPASWLSGTTPDASARDAVFVQVVFAVARGAGGMRIAEDAAGWLHDRYAPWLTARKPGLAESPLEIWQSQGHAFLSRFREIGQRAAAVSPADGLTLHAIRESAWSVEHEAPCPHCPFPPPPYGREQLDLWSALAVSG